MIGLTTTAVGALMCTLLVFAPAPEQAAATSEFAIYEIWIDSHAMPLAAWQVELRGEGDVFRIVGIEGGAHPAFAEPARHDPAALQGGRVVLAAWDTGSELPTGSHRLATVHVFEKSGAAPPAAELVVAADVFGEPMEARIRLVKGD